jgi:hypothetical protein
MSTKVIPLQRPAERPAKRTRSTAKARVGVEPGTCLAELSNADWLNIARAMGLDPEAAANAKWTDGRSVYWLFAEIIAYPISRMDFDDGRPGATEAVTELAGLADRLTNALDFARACNPHVLAELDPELALTAHLTELRDDTLQTMSRIKSRGVIDRRSRAEVADQFLGGIAAIVKASGVDTSLPSRGADAARAEDYPLYRVTRCVVRLALARARTQTARDELQHLNNLKAATLLDRLHRARRKWPDMPLCE